MCVARVWCTSPGGGVVVMYSITGEQGCANLCGTVVFTGACGGVDGAGGTARC